MMTTRKKHSWKEKAKEVATTVEEAENDRIPIFGLWAFEAISALLRRLGGDDELKLLSYVGEKLPQHTRLVLAKVIEAEHDPQIGVCEDNEMGA
ncbi:hypothetical protein Bca4012_054270 [Brassica carinata]